jgi:hypothetical protein
MLPQDNAVSEIIYEVKQIIYPLGLEVENIHACKNDCILYRGAKYEDLENALFVDSTDSIIKKTAVMTKTATKENVGLKNILVLSYHSSFEAFVCK